jgi:hypothetical protein
MTDGGRIYDSANGAFRAQIPANRLPGTVENHTGSRPVDRGPVTIQKTRSIPLIPGGLRWGPVGFFVYVAWASRSYLESDFGVRGAGLVAGFAAVAGAVGGLVAVAGALAAGALGTARAVGRSAEFFAT